MVSTFDEATKTLIVNTSSGGTNPWLTFAITLLSGVIVFIVGQILFTIWIVPLQKYKEIKQTITYQLTYQACYYSDPAQTGSNSENHTNASNSLRECAAKLQGFTEILSWPHIGIPSKKILFEASKDLIGLSNGLYSWKAQKNSQINQNKKLLENIKKRLNLNI